MKPFSELTVRGQARRLRPLAFKALTRYDLDVDRLDLVRNDLNGIFRVRTTGGPSYLLRIARPGLHDEATLRAEADWLRALAGETDIPTPKPVPASDGEVVVTASAPGVPEPRHCLLFSWLPGRHLQGGASASQAEKLGHLMARLHDHTERWQPPDSFRVRTLDKLYAFGDPAGLLREQNRELFDSRTRALIADVEQRVRAELDRNFASSEPQIIHADLHWWNVKIYRGRLQPLDFEDLAWGFPVQDIAVSLAYTQRDERFPALRDAFRRGYTATRPWPEAREGQIDLLMLHRVFEIFNYLIASDFPRREGWFPRTMDNIRSRYQDLRAAG